MVDSNCIRNLDEIMKRIEECNGCNVIIYFSDPYTKTATSQKQCGIEWNSNGRSQYTCIIILALICTSLQSWNEISERKLCRTQW